MGLPFLLRRRWCILYHVGIFITSDAKMNMTKKIGKEGSKSQKTIYLGNVSTLNFYRNIIGGVTVSNIRSTILRIAFGLF